MIKVYGIKNCTSVKKSISFLKEKNLNFDFFDFKKESCPKEKIQSWIDARGIDVVLNKKGATYRNLGLSKMNLSDSELLEQMANSNLLIKRPIIEYKENVIIGFDEEIYKDTF